MYTIEGTFNVTYRSVDRIANAKAPNPQTLKIDRTAPGILVRVQTPQPLLRAKISSGLTPDPAQRLAYVVSDYADNKSLIFVNLRSEPDEHELTVLQVQHPRDKKNGKPNKEMVRNSVIYRRRRG